MRDLASAVGIEAASLYNHIKSKNELLEGIAFDMAEDFFTELALVEDSRLNPSEKLPLYIRSHINVIVGNMNAAAVFLHEWRYLDEHKLQEFIILRVQYEDKFVQLIKEGMDCGDFKQVDEKFYTMSLFSSMNWLYDWYKPEGEFSPDGIADRISRIFLQGIINE